MSKKTDKKSFNPLMILIIPFSPLGLVIFIGCSFYFKFPTWATLAYIGIGLAILAISKSQKDKK